jgi:hypothetical protein
MLDGNSDIWRDPADGPLDGLPDLLDGNERFRIQVVDLFVVT